MRDRVEKVIDAQADHDQEQAGRLHRAAAGGRVTQFKKATQSTVHCDICGEVMHAMFGAGWDNDRLVCADRECAAEIIFPTSTEVPTFIAANTEAAQTRKATNDQSNVHGSERTDR